jgi:hypothetical protein
VVAELSRLERLVTTISKLLDESFETLSRSKSLKIVVLDTSGKTITEAGLMHLVKIPTLEQFTASRIPLTTEAIKEQARNNFRVWSIGVIPACAGMTCNSVPLIDITIKFHYSGS